MGKAIVLLKRKTKTLPSARLLKKSGFHISSAIDIGPPEEDQQKAPCRNEAAGGEETTE